MSKFFAASKREGDFTFSESEDYEGEKEEFTRVQRDAKYLKMKEDLVSANITRKKKSMKAKSAQRKKLEKLAGRSRIMDSASEGLDSGMDVDPSSVENTAVHKPGIQTGECSSLNTLINISGDLSVASVSGAIIDGGVAGTSTGTHHSPSAGSPGASVNIDSVDRGTGVGSKVVLTEVVSPVVSPVISNVSNNLSKVVAKASDISNVIVGKALKGGSVLVDRISTNGRKAVEGSGIGLSANSSNNKNVGEALSLIKREVNLLVGSGKIVGEVAGQVLEIAASYEHLIVQMLGDNERLRGRIDILGKNSPRVPASVPVPAPRVYNGAPPVAPSLGNAPLQVQPVSLVGRPSYAQVVNPAGPVASPPVARPVQETFGVLVKSTTNGTSKEVQKKVLEEVAPALGVRVRAVQPNKTGCEIRLPSAKERDIVVRSAKFQEVGLSTEVRKKQGPRLVIQKVPKQISPEDFMGDLRKHNLRDFSEEAFRREVKLVSTPWEKKLNETIGVIIECSNKVAEILLEESRCYIKHFCFVVKNLSPVMHCFKCLSMDHVQVRCKAIDKVCRRCGQLGHTTFRCRNPIHCRDCDFRGYSAGHKMLSDDCPFYRAAYNRAVSRN